MRELRPCVCAWESERDMCVWGAAATTTTSAKQFRVSFYFAYLNDFLPTPSLLGWVFALGGKIHTLSLTNLLIIPISICYLWIAAYKKSKSVLLFIYKYIYVRVPWHTATNAKTTTIATVKATATAAAATITTAVTFGNEITSHRPHLLLLHLLCFLSSTFYLHFFFALRSAL